MLYKFLRIVFFIIFKMLYRVEVFGRENIPLSGKFIVCANHKSNFDPIMISAHFKRQIHWMAKKELFNNKLLGKFIATLGAFSVDRTTSDLKAIKTALRYLKNGEILGIFPEGTRVKKIDLENIKSGTALIAHKSKSLIVPVYIDGDYKAFRKIKIYIREPIDIREKKGLKEIEYLEISREVITSIYGKENIIGNNSI